MINGGFPVSDSLLTPNQVAAILAVQPSTVYAAASDGRLPCVRLWQGVRRSLLRFRRRDIEEFIQQQSRSRASHEQERASHEQDAT